MCVIWSRKLWKIFPAKEGWTRHRSNDRETFSSTEEPQLKSLLLHSTTHLSYFQMLGDWFLEDSQSQSQSLAFFWTFPFRLFASKTVSYSVNVLVDKSILCVALLCVSVCGWSLGQKESISSWNHHLNGVALLLEITISRKFSFFNFTVELKNEVGLFDANHHLKGVLTLLSNWTICLCPPVLLSTSSSNLRPNVST